MSSTLSRRFALEQPLERLHASFFFYHYDNSGTSSRSECTSQCRTRFHRTYGPRFEGLGECRMGPDARRPDNQKKASLHYTQCKMDVKAQRRTSCSGIMRDSCRWSTAITSPIVTKCTPTTARYITRFFLSPERGPDHLLGLSTSHYHRWRWLPLLSLFRRPEIDPTSHAPLSVLLRCVTMLVSTLCTSRDSVTSQED